MINERIKTLGNFRVFRNKMASLVRDLHLLHKSHAQCAHARKMQSGARRDKSTYMIPCPTLTPSRLSYSFCHLRGWVQMAWHDSPQASFRIRRKYKYSQKIRFPRGYASLKTYTCERRVNWGYNPNEVQCCVELGWDRGLEGESGRERPWKSSDWRSTGCLRM